MQDIKCNDCEWFGEECHLVSTYTPYYNENCPACGGDNVTPRKTSISVENFVQCSLCGDEVSPLEIFSKGECVECHEKNFVFDGKQPDFVGSINKK